jgi:hypothetical protein
MNVAAHCALPLIDVMMDVAGSRKRGQCHGHVYAPPHRFDQEKYYRHLLGVSRGARSCMATISIARDI